MIVRVAGLEMLTVAFGPAGSSASVYRIFRMLVNTTCSISCCAICCCVFTGPSVFMELHHGDHRTMRDTDCGCRRCKSQSKFRS